MAQTHDWVTPRLYGQPWFEKPVLYYWVAGIAFRFLKSGEIAARLPSSIAALLATCAIGWFALKAVSYTHLDVYKRQYERRVPGLDAGFFQRNHCDGGIPHGRNAGPVSYTHLDVYKRQMPVSARSRDAESRRSPSTRSTSIPRSARASLSRRARIRTECPAERSRPATWLPTKPVAPVTSVFIEFGKPLPSARRWLGWERWLSVRCHCHSNDYSNGHCLLYTSTRPKVRTGFDNGRSTAHRAATP